MRKYIVLPILLSVLFSVSCRKEEKNVLLIGADGFSSEVIRKNPGAFPHIEQLMREGSHTLERRSILPSSSACNWASMMMGASPELHGYTTWGSAQPDLPSRETGRYGMFPGIFGLIREQRPEASTGFFYEWPVMGSLYDKGSETVSLNGNDREITAAALEFMKQKSPVFTFICYHEPDSTGHAKGWESPEYREACKKIDDYVGKLREHTARLPMGERTVVIFTSDHGGKGRNHGGKTMSEMESPLVMAGPGIKREYTIRQSVMVYDTASTIAEILGLEQPHVWIGRPVKEAEEG